MYFERRINELTVIVVHISDSPLDYDAIHRLIAGAAPAASVSWSAPCRNSKAASLTLIVNWPALLKKGVEAK